MADGREAREQVSEREERPKTPSARAPRRLISGTFERPSLDLPPPRPVIIGFVLPDDVAVPDLVGVETQRVTSAEQVPATSRPRNALVVHAGASPSLIKGVLLRARRLQALPSPILQPVFVLGGLPASLELHGVAQRNGYIEWVHATRPGKLLAAARKVAVYATYHAAHDPLSQIEWARGSLGDWIAAAHPALGPQARVVLALAALGIHAPKDIAARMGRGDDVIYHHVSTIKDVTGATSLEHAAGRFQRMVPTPEAPFGTLIVPLDDALFRTPFEGIEAPPGDSSHD